ncbi:hypothetical protein [Gimesia chilikensis]|uniref:hypothetical protein n=1 Tax=Gimesia chilikensis TaxID=2605989 RepID=UPI001187FEEB|nr:hypothetical protein [Gimesia chilikensis]QDT83656.1 hypothetical protein MalM14_12890 [Gimesia chilikensis]
MTSDTLPISESSNRIFTSTSDRRDRPAVWVHQKKSTSSQQYGVFRIVIKAMVYDGIIEIEPQYPYSQLGARGDFVLMESSEKLTIIEAKSEDYNSISEKDAFDAEVEQCLNAIDESLESKTLTESEAKVFKQAMELPVFDMPVKKVRSRD